MNKMLVCGIFTVLLSGAAGAHVGDCPGGIREGGRGANYCKPQPPHSVKAPEISMAPAFAALTVLLGGLVVLRGRRMD